MSAPAFVARLGGVASCRELNALGVPTAAITREVRVGGLARVRNGWVALPSGAPPDVVAAVRAGGTLSCVSALALHSIWTSDALRHIRVGRYAHHPPPDRRTRIHRAYPLAGLEPAVGGVDSVQWALAHAVMCQSRRDAVAALDSALHLNRITPTGLRAVLGQLPACHGALGDLCDPAAESGLETHVRLLLRSVGIMARTQVRIEGIGRVDMIVGDRLVIETDGRAWHSDARSFAEDKRRDLALMRLGFLVLRLSYAQVVHDPASVLAAVRSVVARGDHRWSARHRRVG